MGPNDWLDLFRMVNIPLVVTQTCAKPKTNKRRPTKAQITYERQLREKAEDELQKQRLSLARAREELARQEETARLWKAKAEAYVASLERHGIPLPAVAFKAYRDDADDLSRDLLVEEHVAPVDREDFAWP